MDPSRTRPETSKIIISPRWSKPEPVRAGSSFLLVICKLSASPWQLVARARNGSTVALPIRQKTVQHGDYDCLTVELPPSLRPGLYDLAVIVGDTIITEEPNCLWLRDSENTTFTCAHISDLHIVRREQDQSAEIDALLNYLATVIKPDFIINTGDLITRYNNDKLPLPPAAVYPQLRQIRKLITNYRIPHFVSPGNHDIAWPFIHREWLRLMGGPWNRKHDDYAFTHGKVKFIGLDRSVTYDHQHRAIGDHKLTGVQHDWLQHELETLPSELPAIIFCHYDYRQELSRYLLNYNVFKVLYGHSQKPCIKPEFSKFDGGLRGCDFQLLELNSEHQLLLRQVNIPT